MPEDVKKERKTYTLKDHLAVLDNGIARDRASIAKKEAKKAALITAAKEKANALLADAGVTAE